MDVALLLILVVAVVWLIARTRGGTAGTSKGARAPAAFRAEIETAVERDFARAPSSGELRRVDGTSASDHKPPAPAGRAVEAWSPRTKQLEVAGEWYRADNLRRLFERHARLSDSGDEVNLPAVLVPDPTNPYDNRAVAVFVDGRHVGYMERADAARYHQAIAVLPGGELRVPSRQWLRATAQDTWARVTLSLPVAEHLRCPNPADASCVILPPGSTVQVTREEEHMEHLRTCLAKYGNESVIAASLRSAIEQRPRSTVELVAVDIDGEQVGVLTPTQTANFLPLIRRAEAEGRAVICRASLRGNSLKADVALHARKAHELDQSALELMFS